MENEDIIQELLSQMIICVDGIECIKIPLTKGYFAIVDLDDYWKVKGVNWHINECDGKYYARSLKHGFMHRYIMSCGVDLYIDHKNNDGLDNRRSNLRLSNNSLNQANRKKSLNPSTSMYKGVSFEKSRNKWISKIKCNQKDIWIGRFDTEEEAARAYNDKAFELFGNYSKLNRIL